MLSSPALTTLLRLCILCFFIFSLWFFSSRATSQIFNIPSAQQTQSQIPVVVSQMQSQNGVPPVELNCDPAELSAPNSLERLRCVIKNNTNKKIIAVTIKTSILLHREGKSSLDSSFLTLQAFVHPDFYEEHRDNLISPGGEMPVEDAAVSYDDAVITGLRTWIDYVEFADNTVMGINQAGSRILTDIRTGATKYKNWLAQKYHRSGKSLDAIAPLLEKNQPLPAEIGIQNGDQQQGAILYRNYARKTHENKGADALLKHLKSTTAPAHQ